MKTICNILILVLLILFLWNFLIKSKESFKCDIAMGQYKQCFVRHQGRNNKNLSRVNNEMSKLNGLLTKLSERNKKFVKTYTKTSESINGLEKVAKGEPRENPPEACDKSPESC
tara:strand:+ start:124 stop:465 length:342 start_codon:yes stop_codon:yes gene_type:complete